MGLSIIFCFCAHLHSSLFLHSLGIVHYYFVLFSSRLFILSVSALLSLILVFFREFTSLCKPLNNTEKSKLFNSSLFFHHATEGVLSSIIIYPEQSY